MKKIQKTEKMGKNEKRAKMRFSALIRQKCTRLAALSIGRFGTHECNSGRSPSHMTPFINRGVCPLRPKVRFFVYFSDPDLEFRSN